MVLISEGRGMRSLVSLVSSRSISSAMMSLHSPMHSSQMYTVGPAISFFTSFCDLPQKEQQRVWLSRFSTFLPAMMPSLRLTEAAAVVHHIFQSTQRHSAPSILPLPDGSFS